MGAFCAEYRRRRPPGSIEPRAVDGVNGWSDGEDFNNYVCTEQEVEEEYVQMLGRLARRHLDHRVRRALVKRHE